MVTEIKLTLDEIVEDLSPVEKVEVVKSILGESRGYSDDNYKERREDIESILKIFDKETKIYLIKILAESLQHS